MDLPATFADARRRLTARPVGRTPLGIRRLGLALDQATDALDAVAPIAGDVLVGLVLDVAPEHEVAVADGMLRQWGVTLEQALGASFEEHGREHPSIERIDGAVLVADRSFAAFVLRTPSAARGLVTGSPVALVPTDRHLVLAARGDRASLAAALRIAERVAQEPGARRVSARALAATAAGWEPVALPEAEPAASDLARRFAWLAYDDQRPLLQAFYDRSRQQCHVADTVLVRGRDGALQLVATITEGVPTALPWVDAVSLVRGGAVAAMVPMTRLAETPGLLVPLTDLDPPRWYPTRFPAEFV